MPIVPDDKDWTWVLQRACPECGFDASSLPPESVAPLLRANADSWAGVLRGPATELRRRPAEDRWSPLEYACHVRDVCVLYHERLGLMLREDDPLYPNWDQDLTAVEEDYRGQEPGAVAAQLSEAAARLAASFEAVRGRAVAAARAPQRWRLLHHRRLRPLHDPRPGPPPLRRDGRAGGLSPPHWRVA